MRIKNFDKLNKNIVRKRIEVCFNSLLFLYGLFEFQHPIFSFLFSLLSFFSFYVVCDVDFEKNEMEIKADNGAGFMYTQEALLYFSLICMLKAWAFIILVSIGLYH